jgi:hypothetical protein
MLYAVWHKMQLVSLNIHFKQCEQRYIQKMETNLLNQTSMSLSLLNVI